MGSIASPFMPTPRQGGYAPPWQPPNTQASNPLQFLQFQNRQAQQAGMPLPHQLGEIMPYTDLPGQVGGGGMSGGYGGMQHGKQIQGGMAPGSYHVPNTPPPGPPPPPIPGAPQQFGQPPAQLTPQGFNKGYANDPLQQYNKPPQRMATGGILPPGQTAIVGDNKYGPPGPNAEMIQALPNGGVMVHPNPANIPLGPPPLSDEAQRTVIQNNAAQRPWYQQLAQSLPEPVRRFGSDVGQLLELPKAVYNAPGEFMANYLPDSLTPGYGEMQKALGKENAYIAKTGQVPSAPVHWGDATHPLPPEAQPSKSGIPALLAAPPPPLRDLANVSPETKALTDKLAKGTMDYTPELGPTKGGSAPLHDAPPPQTAWDDSTMLAYLNAHNAGKGDDEATQAAMDFMRTPHNVGPVNFNTPQGQPRTASQDNAILTDWRKQSAPPALPAPPAGLSPASQQAWMDQTQRLSQTREGQAQLMQTEIGQQAVLGKEQRAFKNREELMKERYSPHTVKTENGPVTTIMGHQVKVPPVHPQAGITPLNDGSGLVAVHDGTKSYMAVPNPNGGPPIPWEQYTKQQAEAAKPQKAAKEEPLPPGLHQVPGTNVWQMVGQDHKVISHFQGSPEDGFTPFDPKAAAKPQKAAAPEMEHHFRINPDTQKAEVIKLPKGSKSPQGYQKVQTEDQPEETAAPNIKSIKKV